MLCLGLLLGCKPKDEPTNESQKQEETEKTTTPKYVGVWNNGKFFVSISKNFCYAMFLDNEFIDAGLLLKDNTQFKCISLMTKDTSILKISNITETSIDCDITYKSYYNVPSYIYPSDGEDYHTYGEVKSCKRTYSKMNITPVEITNSIVGKSASTLKYVTNNDITTLFFSPFEASQYLNQGKLKGRERVLRYVYIGGTVFGQVWFKEDNHGSNTFNANDPTIVTYNVTEYTSSITLEQYYLKSAPERKQ